MAAQLLSLVHVAASAVFLGGLVAALFFARRAARSREAGVLGHTFETINGLDRWVTVPASVVVLASGVAAAIRGRFPILRTGWIAWSSALFLASGLVFVFWVLPMQRRVARAARASNGNGDWASLDGSVRSWERRAHVSSLLALAAFVLMVLKPILPAW